jgi:hypothetical protein
VDGSFCRGEEYELADGAAAARAPSGTAGEVEGIAFALRAISSTRLLSLIVFAASSESACAIGSERGAGAGRGGYERKRVKEKDSQKMRYIYI